MQLPRIPVFTPEVAETQERLFAGLKQLFGVSFVAGRSRDSALCDAAIIFGASRSEAINLAALGLRCLAFIDDALRPVHSCNSGIAFANTYHLPDCLRGMELPDNSL
jgi:hypothetical protein